MIDTIEEIQSMLERKIEWGFDEGMYLNMAKGKIALINAYLEDLKKIKEMYDEEKTV